MSLVPHAQIHLMDAKRQLEIQAPLHQKTKELLNAAEFELKTLRMQLGSSEVRHSLSSPSTPVLRGWHKHTHTGIFPQHNSTIHGGINTVVMKSHDQ